MAWCTECDALVRWVVMESGAHMAVDSAMVDFIVPGGIPANGNTDPMGLVCCEKRHDHRQYRGGFVVTKDRKLKAGWRLFRRHITTCPNKDRLRELGRK